MIKPKDNIDRLAIELLKNVKPGPRQHFIADCPFCNKQQHFYFRRSTTQVDRRGRNKTGNWDCKKCGANGSLMGLLARLNRRDLFEGAPIDINIDIELITDFQKNEDIDLSLPSIKMPVGFKRLWDDEYLNSRGFTKQNYSLYQPGITNIVLKYQDYILFPILQDKQPKGFVSRLTWSKPKIKKYERLKGIKKLRYINSKHDIHKTLFGIDEIVYGVTETVILVEGIFDKKAVDNRLKLQNQFDIKCCAKFGKKISLEQIYHLKFKGVKNIIVIEDSDALKESRENSVLLSKYFEVLVGYIKQGDIDEINKKEFFEVFNNLTNPYHFFSSKVPHL